MRLQDHPTVQRYRQKSANMDTKGENLPLEAGRIKELFLAAGADDVGFIEVNRPEIAPHFSDILTIFPRARTVVSIACRLNPENIRCVSRSVSDTEYIQVFHSVNNALHRASTMIREMGVMSMAPSSGFPMDLEKWPGKMWPLSHKPMAVEAGLGRIGLNRLVIHPRFGNFIILGTMLLDREMTEYDRPLQYEPCLNCKLCAAVCPVGAISADGHFSFANCMTHNYRDRMGGFADWVEKIAASKNNIAYRKKVSDPETVSMWQSLAFGICNKSSYCMAVCPAGDEVIGPFIEDKKGYIETVVKPLQQNGEFVFVVPDSDAEAHVTKRYPHKQVKRVANGLRPKSVQNFLESLPLAFQRGCAADLNATYHFSFTGQEEIKATVEICDKKLDVQEGHQGKSNIHVTADSRTWVAFLAKEKNLFMAFISGKIKIKGTPALLKKFAECFPA